MYIIPLFNCTTYWNYLDTYVQERSKMADILKRFNARYLNLTVTYKKGVSDLIISLADFILDYISKECGGPDAPTPAPTCVASGGEPINGQES